MEFWLPVIFAALMALAMLVYVILDGYDLGVGLLLPLGDAAEKDTMIASIGPFWDANETWLVLGVGLLLVAFPTAHGIILGELYLPVAIMLLGLILRGVAFDFRVKARDEHQSAWNKAFAAGSLLAALAQGVMLGRFVTGFAPGAMAWGMALIAGLALAGGYILLGACWLILKTEGQLQLRAIAWARRSLYAAGAAVILVSIATPLASARIAERWFALPTVFLLALVPLATAALFATLWLLLPRLARREAAARERLSHLPLLLVVGIVLLAFYGLSYSVFPYLVIDRLTLWQAAASTAALKVIFYGAVLVLPVIATYTIFAYRVFRGKASELHYG
ncbi:cytochrome d ubiquinol oxidase subunit II [Chitinilyticum piscinae]|uniref:Cytochrome d ubiquinol oxidase subunit II n=1 Tax=Chitinilyticum piscinae TaxID=2866724 RepID=A0A8J7FQ31_9NEIS|nr:cytochrome d ubiquinol oxidase subunit II [Chitinilyticum piscinae]MBE9608571.1 cytochrome d ubiquinol oxidase subunit II [Chitinilyticum piscinae]